MELASVHSVVAEDALTRFEDTCKAISAGLVGATYADLRNYMDLLDLDATLDWDKTVHVSIAVDGVRTFVDESGNVVN